MEQNESTGIRIPPFIRPGDTLGVPAPAYGCTREPYLSRYREAVRRLERRGYRVKAGECVSRDDGLGISSAPERTGRELWDFLRDGDCAALISAGGGELMCTTIEHVPFERLRNVPPKWFMGYSDNTSFIHPCVTIGGTAAIYGPCVTGFGKPWEQNALDALALLEGSTSTVRGYGRFQPPEAGAAREDDPLAPYALTEQKVLRSFACADGAARPCAPGEGVEMEGILLGGCLDVLANLAGTRYDAMREFNARHPAIIWVLEACDLGPLDIRRAMWQLRQAGWFESAAGFLVGRPLAAWGVMEQGVDQYGAVLDEVARLGVPVIMDADVGHIPPAIPLVMGSMAYVRARDNELEAAMRLGRA